MIGVCHYQAQMLIKVTWAVDLLSTNPQQIEVMEFGLYLFASSMQSHLAADIAQTWSPECNWQR